MGGKIKTGMVLWTALLLILFSAVESFATEENPVADDKLMDEFYAEYEQYQKQKELSVEGVGKIVQPDMAVSFNDDTHMMVYELPNGSRFSASVPDGMITTEPVTLIPMENAYVTIMRNGSREKTAEDGYYGREGNYRVSILDYSSGTVSGDRHVYQVNFNFRIIPGEVSSLDLLRAPEGFVIEKLELEGRETEPENPQWEFLHRDGHYRVWFADRDTKKIRYQISFTRDTTAPLLVFSPVIDREIMKQDVEVRISDPQGGVQVYYNGQPVKMTGSLIRDGGSYQFRTMDRVGNERFYSLKMENRFKGPGRRTIITIIIGLAALTAWLLYQRRHMRFL